MTNEAILLVGRKAPHAREVYETHADRLGSRASVGGVHVATYENEPVRELRETFAEIEGDRVYAVPMTTAHTFDTTDGVPAALSYVPGEVRYCEPVGRSPAVTDVLVQRASEALRADDDVSLVLVGFGSSSKPYQRQTTEYHAARLSDQSDYGEVLTCYLLQNPTVECVRYNTSNSRTVAVPLFLTRSEATTEEIPAKLELERGGIEYAEPLGDHARVTDAIHAEVEKQRVLATSEDSPASFETRLTRNRRPVATDGEGVRR
ncbi:sirohydrochlorin chelatase [halophilic archaeon]|nr:sirohydrochlorin chelatase [halophilic archaeon]